MPAWPPPHALRLAPILAPILAAVLLSGAAKAENAPIVIAVKPTAAPGVLVKAAGRSVHMPACRGLVWEAFDSESGRYTPITTEPCGPDQPARKLDKSETAFDLEVDPGAAHAVRAVAVVGLGCEDGKPFALARCDSVVSVAGPPIMLKAGASPK